mmetsp:Transcript_18091/g.51795  ORF Transcript_18091/g.51795 Transcript_18091/m.51795 type:complete len:414 (+) Transcript_18091:213-1454(+)
MEDPVLTHVLTFLLRDTSDHKLRDIHLKGRNIGDDGVQILVDALANGHSSKVQTLNLIGNNVFAAGALSLTSMLRSHHVPSLTKLQLQQNTIGAKGAIFLADALKDKQCNLRHLHLKSCNVGVRGAIALSEALASPHCKLQDLRLEMNNIGDEGCRHIAQALCTNGNSQLYSLELKGNAIGPAGAIAIAEKCLQSKSTALESLGLNDNSIADAGFAAIASALQYNSNLNWLFVSNKFEKMSQHSVDLFIGALFNDTDPNSVCNGSNHALKEIYGIPSDVPNQQRIRRLLRFNKLGNFKARREKIHLFLSENPTCIQTCAISCQLVPRFLSVVGRECHGSLDALFNHIRENPNLLPEGGRDSGGGVISKETLPRVSKRSWRRGLVNGKSDSANRFEELDAALRCHNQSSGSKRK